MCVCVYIYIYINIYVYIYIYIFIYVYIYIYIVCIYNVTLATFGILQNHITSTPLSPAPLSPAHIVTTIKYLLLSNIYINYLNSLVLEGLREGFNVVVG